MAKRKAGLHKRISSIFDGVPIPTEEKVEEPTAAPQTDQSQKTPAGPLPTQLMPQKKLVEPSPPKPAPPVKEKMRPDTRPKALKKQEQKHPAIEARAEQKRQRKMLTILLILSVLFLAVLFQRFYSSRPTEQTEEFSEQQPLSKLINPRNSISSKLIVDEFTIDWTIPESYPIDLRDPMYIPGEEAAVLTGQTTEGETETSVVSNLTIIQKRIVIRSILYSEQGSSVVIGDEIIREGQTILGAKVIKINPYSVEFEVDGEKFLKFLQY